MHVLQLFGQLPTVFKNWPTSCKLKTAINREGNLQNGREELQIVYQIKDYYPEYIKNFYNSTTKNKQTNKQTKMGKGPEWTFLWRRYMNGQ